MVVEGGAGAGVGLQALHGAVGRLHGAAGAGAAEGDRVVHHGVHPGPAAPQLQGPVLQLLVGAHLLHHLAEPRRHPGWVLTHTTHTHTHMRTGVCRFYVWRR